jgi:hypothetical protein
MQGLSQILLLAFEGNIPSLFWKNNLLILVLFRIKFVEVWQ